MYPVADRRFVRERANSRCEYCLIHEDDTGFASEGVETGCKIDHSIAEKHGGLTVRENLVYSCASCNQFKGSHIASIPYSGVIVRFFNPRVDAWRDHFRLDGGLLRPLTPEAEATDRILQLNTAHRREERRELQRLGRYPTSL